MSVPGSLAYVLRDARRFPILSAEHELILIQAWRDKDDALALRELIGSHLRLVIKVARGFAGYGLPLSDLVAEGNMGLLRAARKFDPERGCRFATYALWWIRAAIQEYILHSWSLVKIGTTGMQKHLFFNLRRFKARLGEFESGALSPETAAIISKELNVTLADVVEMNGRISGPDNSLNATIGSEGSDQWLELLSDEQPNQEHLLANREEQRRRYDSLRAALAKLKDREREILVARYLRDEQSTLEQLSQRYAVSRERVRQIEQRAIEKIRRSMLASQVTARPDPEMTIAA